MHWFWRAAIALVVGGIVGLLVLFLAASSLDGMGQAGEQTAFVIALAISNAAAITAYVWADLDKHWEDECRCRKCDYILRGISAPRCPECGERI